MIPNPRNPPITEPLDKTENRGKIHVLFENLAGCAYFLIFLLYSALGWVLHKIAGLFG